MNEQLAIFVCFLLNISITIDQSPVVDSGVKVFFLTKKEKKRRETGTWMSIVTDDWNQNENCNVIYPLKQ